MADLVEKNIHCPYCSEVIAILVDTSVPEQSYVEDCQVCCQPIVMDIVIDETDAVEVYARQENE
ncbi:CPXCG motif-containing cysteine-rich protein [Marinimicrobium sp. C2-29]|uniref:CPXCG motif-containing cysteine-rich protein n=1 Tax=Marinimicrobium sp. C2-29 TaxID=3139825 RepID=UPI003139D1BE